MNSAVNSESYSGSGGGSDVVVVLVVIGVGGKEGGGRESKIVHDCFQERSDVFASTATTIAANTTIPPQSCFSQ